MKKKQEEEEQRNAANKPVVVKSKAKKKEPAGLDDLLSAGLAKGKGKKKWLDHAQPMIYVYVYLSWVRWEELLTYLLTQCRFETTRVKKISTAKVRVYFNETSF